MTKTINRILKTVSTLLIALVVLIAFFMSGIRLLGFQVYTVLSGSMEPAYHTGGLIYVREVDPDRLTPGDVITFKLSGDIIATHRIVELVPDAENPDIVRFRTKGDANEMADGSLVDKSAVMGSPVFTLPYLGFLTAYLQTASGKYMLLAVCAALLLITLIPDLLFNDKEKKEEESRN